MSKANLNYSPLSQRVFWGRTNEKGCSIGEQRDVTSAFIQVMEMKFPPNTIHTITADGEPKFRILVVDMSKEVAVNGKVV